MQEEAEKSRRQDEVLQKLRADAGLKTQITAERLDWMYEDPSAAMQEDSAEAYLLGSKKPEAEASRDIANVKKLQGGKDAAGSIFLTSMTRTTDDTLRKLREDPLLAIKQAELLKRKAVLSNPMLRDQHIREHEKDRKAKKKKRRRNSSSSSSSSSSRRDRAEDDDRHQSRRNKAEDDDRHQSRRNRAEDDDRHQSRKYDDSNNRYRHQNRGKSERKKLSDEERQKRLEEMEFEARRLEAARAVKLKERSEEQRKKEITEEKERLESSKRESSAAMGSKYLEKLQKDAYVNNNLNMEDYLKRAASRRQREDNALEEQDD